MSFKTPILCDRRIYDKKGKWKSPNNDITENVFYFVKEPLTLTKMWNGTREEFKETITITVFGSKPFAEGDLVTLDYGKELKIQSMTVNYVEHNILVKDRLKPRIANTDLTLE